MRREVLFVLCLLPLMGGVALFVAQGPPIDVSRPAALVAIALASGGWVAALALAGRVSTGPALALVMFSGAVCVRVPYLALDPGLSDDHHRYAWEGELVRQGANPYRDAPASEALAAFRERHASVYRGVNHPEVAAAYPPLAQSVHAGLVGLAGGLDSPARVALLLRLFYGLCDLLVCVPLLLLLARRGRPLAWVVAWAWNPWVALEFVGSAHLDALAILCTLSALVCLPPRLRATAGRAALGSALLVAGAAVKLLPIALVPLALRRARRRSVALLGLLLGGLLCVGPFVALTGSLPRPGGLSDYALRWESFNLLYRHIEPLFALLFTQDETLTDPRRLGRLVVLLMWLAIGLLVWRRRFEPARAALWLFGGFLVLTPTLHPWYLTWIVPFLALYPVPAWCLLCALSPLLYWPLERWRNEALWLEPAWLYPLLALPFWALLGWSAWRARRPRVVGASPR